MSQRSNHPHRGEIDRVAALLIAEWARVEPDHGVTKHPVSYVATFADMARVVVEDRLALTAEVERLLRARIAQLEALINTPRVDDFLAAVRIEAAHQVERWGVEHDAGKRPEDWIALVVYLLGKATKAHFDGDREKLLHHVITLGAVALNWHANATGADTLTRPGVGPGEAQFR